MKKPAALPLGAMLIAWSCTFQAVARAQEVATNLVDLAAEAFSSDHCIYLPFTSWEWRAYSLDVGGVLWVDCSQLPCADWVSGSTNLNGSLQAYGVVLTRDVLTGETALQADGSTNVLAVIAAPSDYQPNAQRFDSWVYRSWVQVTNCADCWGIEGGIPPPTVTLKVFLADVNDYAAYESNLEAQAEAAAASAASLGSPSLSMDDEGDDVETDGFGSSCSLTNLLQPFSITRIQRITNDWTAITFPSCPMFRYIVLSADVMSSDAVWQAQAYTSYVWGQPNSTIWTDTTTSASVTQRFYKVQRINGSPIAAGANSSVALRPDGTLWTWGGNDGELGDGLGLLDDETGVELYRPYPGEVAPVTTCVGQTVTNAVAVAAGGDDFTVIADANGTVWTCGENTSAQLGNGLGPDGHHYHVPSAISGVSTVVAVAAGYQHALALRADGKVFAWGDNSGGQLGVGTTGDPTNTPVRALIPTQTVIVAVAAGDFFSMALDSTGNVWTWGYGPDGELGNGTAGDFVLTNVPTVLTTISNVITIAAGGSHAMALLSDKTIRTWGANVGLGRDYSDTYGCGCDPLPGQVPGLSNVVAIAGGCQFSLAATANGQVYGWGENDLGQLSTNADDVSFTNRPMQVVGISNAVLVSAPQGDDIIPFADRRGGRHSLAMTVDAGTNRYWGWGDNTFGDVGDATTSGNGTNSDGFPYRDKPAPVQFCTRCQRCVQLGTSGTFTAQCNGTLYLYFNTDDHSSGSNGTNSYSATVIGLATNVSVSGVHADGVAVGAVTNGGVYNYTASGFCQRNTAGDKADADGKDPSHEQVDCSFVTLNITNAICPARACYSLVGKIR